MLGQYFYNESLRKTIIAFGSLFNDIQITRKDSSESTVQTMKVPLAYGPKQKFITRLTQDPGATQQVALTLPRIGFEIQSFDYDSTRKLNRTIRQKKVSNTTDKKLKQMSTQYTPVPYNMNFELFVMAKNSDDGIQIIEQILPFFQPEYTVSIKEVPDMDIVRDVPFVLNSVGYEDTYEGDFQTRRAIIYTLSFTAKSYVYGPVTTAKPITKVSADTYTDLPATAPTRVQRFTVQATGTGDDDDNFGFNESTSEWV
ncbi:MAG: tail sheath stabilizer and completion protein [Anaerolineales bacterium]|jgi:hypothetical protein|nr:tail sheath stabilizer and completion protein [Anaerolineales bacterium]MDP6770645.1 tail sheath stabilizer and completion protein [Anaerolineales bacterium]